MTHKLGALAVVAVLVAVGCKPYDFNADGAADMAFVDVGSGAHYRVGATEPFWQPEHLPVGQDHYSVLIGVRFLPAPGAFDDRPLWHPGVVNDNGWEFRDAPVFADLPLDLGTVRPVPADYTGDGSTERAVWDLATGTWHIEGMDPIVFGEVYSGGFFDFCVPYSDLPAPGDFDGDGATELAVFRPTDRRFHFSDGSSSQPFPMGMPAVADYDGDGTDDLAVFNGNTATWHFDDGTTFTMDYTLGWGLPAPADYSGSGHDQPVIFSPQTGRWILGVDTVLAEDSRAAGNLATTVRPATKLDWFRMTYLEWAIAEEGEEIFDLEFEADCLS